MGRGRRHQGGGGRTGVKKRTTGAVTRGLPGENWRSIRGRSRRRRRRWARPETSATLRQQKNRQDKRERRQKAGVGPDGGQLSSLKLHSSVTPTYEAHRTRSGNPCHSLGSSSFLSCCWFHQFGLWPRGPVSSLTLRGCEFDHLPSQSKHYLTGARCGLALGLGGWIRVFQVVGRSPVVFFFSYWVAPL